MHSPSASIAAHAATADGADAGGNSELLKVCVELELGRKYAHYAIAIASRKLQRIHHPHTLQMKSEDVVASHVVV